MSWRPAGWKNPYVEPFREGVVWNKEIIEAYEVGADAMLEMLRAQGNSDMLRFTYNVVKLRPLETIGKGKFIFIPDDEEKK